MEGNGVLVDTVVVLDFETTGKLAHLDRATEVAAVMFRDGRIVDQYQTLIYAGVPIPQEITALTGISTAMLRGAPRPQEVFRGLREFIGAMPVVAHYASFDHGVYRAELARAGLRHEPEPFLCTCRLSRRVLPNLDSHKLGTVAAELNVRYRSAAHRALADAEVCAQVLHALCVRIAELGIERVDEPLLQRLMRYTPVAKASTYLKSQAKSRAPAAVAPRQQPRVPTPVVESARPVPAERAPLPDGWRYRGPSAASGTATGPEVVFKPAKERQVAWFAEPEPALKYKVLAQARAERADWVYLDSHRCLIEVATAETYHVLGWPQDSAGMLTFTLKTRPPVRVDRLKLLRG